MDVEIERLNAGLRSRYTLHGTLGGGTMAKVFLATDHRHDRAVAVKVLRTELATAVAWDRFEQEIRIAAGLTHPHIVPVYDSGEAAGHLLFVMARIEGESLRMCLARERRLPPAQALRIATDVADGLAYAHDKGVVHRDVKPENILMQGDHALLADFGVAKAVSSIDDSRLTPTGQIIGTPAYMSPEAVSVGGVVDHRSDVYSLGCVLFEMLTGEPPYRGSTRQTVIKRHLSSPVPCVDLLCDSLPPTVGKAVSRAMAKDPAERFQDAREFAAALS